MFRFTDENQSEKEGTPPPLPTRPIPPSPSTTILNPLNTSQGVEGTPTPEVGLLGRPEGVHLQHLLERGGGTPPPPLQYIRFKLFDFKIKFKIIN